MLKKKNKSGGTEVHNAQMPPLAQAHACVKAVVKIPCFAVPLHPLGSRAD